MPLTYPAPPPTLSGDYETISRFLASPTLITRRIRDLALNRYISDVLLPDRYEVQGGAVMYEQNETQFNARNPEAIGPGGSYPKTLAQPGPALIAAVRKYGQDEPVTDEAIKRLLMNPVNRALLKSVNTNIRFIDSLTLGVISSAVTQTSAAAASWSSGSPQILRDIMKAVSVVTALNQGYNPDTLVVDDLTYAIVASDPTVTNALRREDPTNPIYTGVGGFPVIGGLRVLPTSNSPTPGVPLILDSTMLGGMADEDLGGPGYTGMVKGIQGMTYRDPLQRDQWFVRCRRVTVPVVIEPACAIKITGI